MNSLSIRTTLRLLSAASVAFALVGCAGDSTGSKADGGGGMDGAVDDSGHASMDAATDAGVDAATDAAVDAATDASTDGSTDAATDAAMDAGPPSCEERPCHLTGFCPKTASCDTTCMSGCASQPRSEKSCATLAWVTPYDDYGSPEVCAQSDFPDGGCSGPKNFVDAQAFCSAKGARLCTLPELLNNETRGTGCYYDQELVWSSTDCVGGGHAIAAGSTYYHQGTQCLPDDQEAVVRCCADADPDAEESTCGALDPSCVADLDDSCTSTGGCTEAGPGCSEDLSQTQTCLPDNPVAACLQPTAVQSCFTDVGERCEAGECVFRCENVACDYPNYALGCASDTAGCTDQGTECLLNQPSRLTCAELGPTWTAGYGTDSVCAWSDIDPTTPGIQCSGLVTLTQADQLCRDLGARLCTADELLFNEASGTGCNYDTERVWSLTSCDNGLQLTAAGSVVYADSVPTRCLFGGDAVAVARCCADVDPGIYVAGCRAKHQSFP